MQILMARGRWASRISLLSWIMLAATSVSLSRAAPAPAEQTTLTYASFGGALRRAEEAAWLIPFEKEHPNIKIVYDNIDYAKIKVMVQSGRVSWDVMLTASDFGLRSDEYLLEKLDCKQIPCGEIPPDQYQTTGYRVGATTSGVVLGYNKSRMPPGLIPHGWADMFDLKKFPGKRVVMMDASSFVFEQALIADGVDPKHLYPLDLNRAIRKLDSLGDRVTIAPSYQGCAELVAAGEAVMGGCWSGRFTDVIERAMAPVAICWNQGIVSNGYLSVPKGTKHKDLAMEFIAWILSPRHNAAISNYITYGPANPKALMYVNEAAKPNIITSHLEKAVFPDNVWYDANRAEVNKRWTAWISGME